MAVRPDRDPAPTSKSMLARGRPAPSTRRASEPTRREPAMRRGPRSSGSDPVARFVARSTRIRHVGRCGSRLDRHDAGDPGPIGRRRRSSGSRCGSDDRCVRRPLGPAVVRIASDRRARRDACARVELLNPRTGLLSFDGPRAGVLYPVRSSLGNSPVKLEG